MTDTERIAELESQLAEACNNVERVAQLTAHRACHGAEHDPLNGKIHGYCIVCGVPWPCETANIPCKHCAEKDREIERLKKAREHTRGVLYNTTVNETRVIIELQAAESQVAALTQRLADYDEWVRFNEAMQRENVEERT